MPPQECFGTPEDSVQLCKLAAVGAGADDALTLVTASMDDCTAGSLCCAETQEALEEDCSSAGELEEEGFVVYQSPLSLAPHAPGTAAGGGPRAPAAPPPQVLTECEAQAAPQELPPLLASDPDLQEMLRCGRCRL